MRRLLRGLRRNDSGQGLTEYALIIALVAVALIGVLGVFRNGAGNVYARTVAKLQCASGGACPPAEPPPVEPGDEGGNGGNGGNGGGNGGGDRNDNDNGNGNGDGNSGGSNGNGGGNNGGGGKGGGKK